MIEPPQKPPRFGFTRGDRFIPYPKWISDVLRLGLLFPLAVVTRGMTLGAQVLVRNTDGDVLLIKQSYSAVWQFPGGGVDRAESIYEAAERELKEEAGVLCNSPPTLLGLYTNFSTFPGDHVAFFEATDWHQPIIPEPNAEIIAQGFFPVDDLPENTARSVRRRLSERIGNVEIACEWTPSTD
ncbi:MAG: NUDIX domain-containing protein [Pseudomonadota bacterium]